MKNRVLVAEIGSTTTVVNCFEGINSPCPKFIGQGQAPTTVFEGDVNIGLENAINSLENKLGIKKLEYNELFATSSAAGGLKMTVHGLVYDMTARAAKEAALGAGAIIHKITAGKLLRTDIKKIKEIEPNIILIAGGVDYGERNTAIENAEKLAQLDIDVPIIYAGNIENQEEIKEIFYENNKRNIVCVENVYPKIDQLNVEPTRKVIQDVFEEHIIYAPGMKEIKKLVNGSIIPTPGAVMEASKLLKEEIGDLITIDVGGATTDIHSVTSGSDEINRILISPEPEAKRTVEGDLGVYVNAKNISEKIGHDVLKKDLGETSDEYILKLLEDLPPIPTKAKDIELVERLSLEAVKVSIKRHSGKLRSLYGSNGKTTIAEGKDLSNVKYIINTGGALTRLPNKVDIVKKGIISQDKDNLSPNKDVEVLIDNHYIMASLGVLSKKYPESALKLMKNSLNI